MIDFGRCRPARRVQIRHVLDLFRVLGSEAAGSDFVLVVTSHDESFERMKYALERVEGQ